MGVIHATALIAQATPGVEVDLTLGEGLAGGAVSAFLTTLILGAIFVAVFPDASERLMASVVDDPFNSVAYGVFALFAVVLMTLALVMSVIGIPVAVLLLVSAYVAWGAGAAIAFLAIADRLVGHADGWLLRLQLDGHEALYALNERATELDVRLDVLELHQSAPAEDRTEYGLTESQAEALVAAYVRGYYDEPRETSLSELADTLGISETAVSGRLRRGSARLVESILVDEQPE